MIHSESLLERFLRYVAIDTTANDKATTYPSSEGQLVLGRLLARELSELGIQDVVHNQHGLVIASLPASIDGSAPVRGARMPTWIRRRKPLAPTSGPR